MNSFFSIEISQILLDWVQIENLIEYSWFANFRNKN